MGSDKIKTIELIKRLEEAFPEAEFILIRQEFRKFDHNQAIDIIYTVSMDALPSYSPDLYGITAVEAYVDTVIINKVNQEA